MSAHKKVMIVDDEESVRVSFNRYLSSHGFDVLTEEDGGDAISRLRAEAVDVVVADLKMPRVDGLELLRWMHDERPDTPFILLTGYGNDEVERKARELGAYEYLNKPISPDALSAVLTAATVLKILPDSRVEPVATVAPATGVAVKPVAAERTVPAPKKRGRLFRAIELLGGLIVAPLIGLLYVLILPLVGAVTIVWTAGEKIWSAIKPSEA